MGLIERRHEETYGESEVKARLQDELPSWYLEQGWIRRKYKTSGWKGTLMVVNTVGHLAEAAFHHPDLTVSYAFVIVKLTNHAGDDIPLSYCQMWCMASSSGVLFLIGNLFNSIDEFNAGYNIS